MSSSLEPSKTRRLYLVLRDRIVSGAERPGTRLPGEPQLAARHGVSRVTVRRALEALENEGLIRRQAGAGTFVLGADGRRTLVADLSNMLAHLVEMGRATRVKLLAFGYEAAPKPVAEALGLGAGARVQRAVRVRYVDDAAFSHLVTWVPEAVGATYSEADLASTPLLALLERSGIVAERATQSVSATLAGPEHAEALGVDVGSPLIAMTRTVFDPDGQGVEHLHALYRPDRYTLQTELVRITRGGERRWSPVDPPPEITTRAGEPASTRRN
jgi:GntR family transcriptional regulator